MEALYLGLPLIATDHATGAARELIGADKGILVPVGDCAAMTAAIVKMMNDASFRHAMRAHNRAARRRSCRSHDGQKWLSALEILCRGRGRQKAGPV